MIPCLRLACGNRGQIPIVLQNSWCNTPSHSAWECQLVLHANASLAGCTLGVTCTSANSIVLKVPPPARRFHQRGRCCHTRHGRAESWFVPAHHETRHGLPRPIDADHEVGEFVASQLESAHWATVGHVGRRSAAEQAPAKRAFLFKRCGWAGWDLAAARLALRQSCHF